MIKSYCLNLHERYAPNWSVWECARELFANARDAAADTMKVSSPDANTLEIWTPTVPEISELFIIGCGSKTASDQNIGQFGEGLKLTALAATRNANDTLTILLPKHTITFGIREHFGERVLFADVEDAENSEGCTCILKMAGAGYALNGKVIDGKESYALPKDPKGPVQIFCKGIWICSVEENFALFSYNLNNVELNRDRSHANPYSIRNSIADVLVKTMDDNLADQLMQHPECWEAEKCIGEAEWIAPESVRVTLAEAFRRRHGDMALVRTNADVATKARDLGYQVPAIGAGVASFISNIIPTDTKTLAGRYEFEEAPAETQALYVDELTELHRLAELLEIPDITVKVFSKCSNDIQGRADIEARIVWINQRLFTADDRFERVHTFLHELAHILSGAGDATHSFEVTLGQMMAKLAVMALEVK
jgi:hypothetical protein